MFLGQQNEPPATLNRKWNGFESEIRIGSLKVAAVSRRECFAYFKLFYYVVVGRGGLGTQSESGSMTHELVWKSSKKEDDHKFQNWIEDIIETD